MNGQSWISNLTDGSLLVYIAIGLHVGVPLVMIFYFIKDIVIEAVLYPIYNEIKYGINGVILKKRIEAERAKLKQALADNNIDNKDVINIINGSSFYDCGTFIATEGLKYTSGGPYKTVEFNEDKEESLIEVFYTLRGMGFKIEINKSCTHAMAYKSQASVLKKINRRMFGELYNSDKYGKFYKLNGLRIRSLA